MTKSQHDYRSTLPNFFRPNLIISIIKAIHLFVDSLTQLKMAKWAEPVKIHPKVVYLPKIHLFTKIFAILNKLGSVSPYFWQKQPSFAETATLWQNFASYTSSGKILLIPLIIQNHFVKTFCAKFFVGIDFENPRFHCCFWPNSKVVLLRFLLFLFCSASLPLTSTRRFDQHIQAFPHSKKCCGLISAKWIIVQKL